MSHEDEEEKFQTQVLGMDEQGVKEMTQHIDHLEDEMSEDEDEEEEHDLIIIN